MKSSTPLMCPQSGQRAVGRGEAWRQNGIIKTQLTAISKNLKVDYRCGYKS